MQCGLILTTKMFVRCLEKNFNINCVLDYNKSADKKHMFNKKISSKPKGKEG